MMLPGNTPTLMGGESGNDSYTKLLLHFNDLSMMDVSIGGSERRIVTPHNVYISTATKKFGSGSAVFGGAGNQYIFVKNSPDFDFGTGSFTVDWWEYRLSSIDGSASFRRNIDNNVCGYLLNHAVANRYQTYMSSNGSSWDVASGVDSGPITFNAWVHYAVVRNGNTFYVFKDGVQQATWSSSLALIAAPANHLLTIGHWNGNGFSGYMDEIRISKGIARWTSNFVPPQRAYGPNPDYSAYHTVGLWHFDGASNAAGTAFPDSSPYAKGNTGGNGYGYGSLYKFGNSSSYFDGGNYYNVIPGDEDWNFGSGDFTFDWWDWRSDLVDNRPGIVRSTEWSSYPPFLVGWMAGGNLYCYCSSDNASWNVLVNFSLGPVTANVWSHRAFARKNGTFYGFKDGVLQSTYSNTSAALPALISTSMFCGVWNHTASPQQQYWGHGLIEELRISKGIARWTANFTPPTAPYT